MKWLKRVGLLSLLILACSFLLSSPTHAQNEGYWVIFIPDNLEKLKKLEGRKLQFEDKTSKLKIVKPEDRETVTVKLNLDGVGKPIKKTKILSTLREEINKQKNGKERREIEIRIMIDDEIGLSQEEFVKKYADIFKDSYVDLSKRQASFFAKLNIEQIEALEKLDEVKYLSKIDDVVGIYGEIDMQQIPFLSESTKREEIDAQKQKKNQDKIEIAILFRYDVDISKEEFVKKHADLFEGSFIDIEGHKLSFLAKLNVEQIEKLAMLDEVSYLSKSDDSLELYGEVGARKTK